MPKIGVIFGSQIWTPNPEGRLLTFTVWGPDLVTEYDTIFGHRTLKAVCEADDVRKHAPTQLPTQADASHLTIWSLPPTHLTSYTQLSRHARAYFLAFHTAGSDFAGIRGALNDRLTIRVRQQDQFRNVLQISLQGDPPFGGQGTQAPDVNVVQVKPLPYVCPL